MAFRKVPSVLREKLGEDVTDGLVELIFTNEQEQETRFARFFNDTISLRMAASESKMLDRIQESELRMFAEINALRKETHAGFLDTHKQIVGIHTQITTQTRWLIGIASFLAIAMKLIDIIIG